ncbi:MAG TPA: hypothetical protein VMV83_16390 [Rectinemataceae bacterium]|nr:hypothetical protein [Rectinemataceae bacterium]
MKKFFALLVLATLITGGAFGQLMLGVTGDLHMDTQMSASEISAQFKDGSNIFYGPFAEIAFGRLGIGLAGTYKGWSDYYLGDMVTYDVAGYFSYHLFKARAFLDPFGELGFGYIANDYASSNPSKSIGYAAYNPLNASMFWYGALGLGINLGPIGIFGKMSYNNAIKQQMDMVDSSGNTVTDTSTGVALKVPPYGTLNPSTGYWSTDIPAMRFTLGAKLLLF